MVDWTRTHCLENSYFSSLNLTATSYHMLICDWCDIALPPQRMLGHLSGKAHPPQVRTVIDRDAFKRAASLCNLHEKIPASPQLPVPPVAGLGVHDGYSCPACHFCSRSKGTLRKHYSKHHSDRQKPSSWPSCYVQRLCTFRSHSWFKVIPSTQPTNHTATDIEAIVQNFSRTVYTQGKVTDKRMISPWLLSTGWYERTQGQDIASLRAAVAIGSQDEYPRLRVLICQYLHQNVDLIDLVDTVVRQRLNTDYPEKQCVHNMTYATASSDLLTVALIAHLFIDTNVTKQLTSTLPLYSDFS